MSGIILPMLGMNAIASSATLFQFSTHTFTSTGKVGRFGPTLSEMQTSYSGQVWSKNTNYLHIGRAQGYQVFQIPKTGIYEIEIAGARGQTASNFTSGTWGQGAIIRARIGFTISDKIEMVVGQVPGDGSTVAGTSSAGAGGGSFISYYGTNNPIIVAGGGGGFYNTLHSQSILNGQTRRQPTYSGFSYSPAVSGTDPALMGGGKGYHSGGGGGWNTAGQDYSGYAGSGAASADSTGGQMFTHGAPFIGGLVSTGSTVFYAVGGNSNQITTIGGFGGGGGGHTGNNSGGGGGGYSGGLGGQSSLGGSYTMGMGGGSFIISSATNVATSDGQYDGVSTFNGTITNLAKYNNGGGYIKITYVG